MIENAYLALAERLALALVACGFLDAVGELQVDPAAIFTPTGDEEDLLRVASLVQLQTTPVRQILGRASPRYVVDRQCRLELAMAGPARLQNDALFNSALAAVAILPAAAPTLGGTAERLTLGERTDEDLPPNGTAVSLTFTLRVRSSDPLGCTP